MRTVKGNVTRFERLGPREGLSEVTTKAILQDSTGFLWVGTQDGLNKYDGYIFSVYRHDPTDPASLTSNQITAIVEDSLGFLWVGTRNGLNRFDRKADQFKRYPTTVDDRLSSTGHHVTALTEDSNGSLWVGTVEHGLLRLDRQTDQFTLYRHAQDDPYSLPHNHVSAILEDGQGVLWVGTLGGGLCPFDRKTGRFLAYCPDKRDTDRIGIDLIIALFEDARGTLWVGTQNSGIYAREYGATTALVHYQHDENAPQSLSSDRITCFVENGPGKLWIGTQKGLNQLDVQTGQIQRHYHREDDLYSLSHSEILALAPDAQGNLWVGTRVGLSKFDPTTPAFGHLCRNAATPDSLSGNLVTALLVDSQGTLWVGTYGAGLNVQVAVDPPRFLHFEHDGDDPHSLADIRALPDDHFVHPYGDNGIYAIFEDSSKSLWLGTGAGLHRVVPGETADSAPVFARYPYDKKRSSGLSHACVRAIAQDRLGNLWIGTHGGGLNKLAPAEGTAFVYYRHDPDDLHSLSNDNVRIIYCDSRGDVWVGTENGLNRIVIDGDIRFVRYQHDRRDPRSMSNNLVTCISEDATGDLWIGTGGGLNRFDPQTGRFVSYTARDGLSQDFVDGLLVDDRGCVWVSAKRINKFDPTTASFTHYDTHDGVQSDEFTIGACCRDQQGRLYFGGINGLNVFHPDDIPENTYLPPVVLTGFLLANKPVPISESGPLKEHINFATHVELGPEDYLFAFEFTALNYRQPQKSRFAYKLEGFDRDWIQADARDRKAVYTNVPPGQYTFRVKAANDDGLWNEDGASIQVIVSQPWWHILFGSAFEAVVIHDQGTILQVNQAALEMFGYEQAELIGESVYMLVSPESHAQVARRIAARDETPYELTGVRKDGSSFDGEVRTRAIPYQGREVQVVAVRDITERKRAEQILRRSEEFLQAALDSLSAHIAILDSNGTIVAVNSAWRRFGEQNGLAWTDYGIGCNYLSIAETTSGEDAQSALQAARGIREVTAGQRRQFRLQYPCHGPEQERWFEMQATRFENTQGVQVVLAHENITGRVRALQALRESEAKFRDFVEQSTDGMFLVDEQGAVIEWNRSLAQITGLEREDVLGLPAWEVQHRLLVDEHRNAAVAERFKATMTEALRTGETPLLERPVEAVFRRTGGTTRHVEQRLFLIETDRGFRIGGISTDITERREVEEQLRKLSRAVEQSDSTILITDLEGTIEFVNPAFTRVTGYPAQEAIGQNPRLLKSGQMPQEVYVDLWQTITRGQVWEGELLNRRKDDTLYWEWAIISPVRDPAGNTTHFVGAKQDITARKRVGQALEQRVRHERALAACSQTLLRASDGQPVNVQILNQALAYLREAVEASRAYVFRNFEDPQDGFCSGIVAEAVMPGLPSNLDHPFSQKIPWSWAPVQHRLALEARQAYGGLIEELFSSTPRLLEPLMEMSILSVQFFPIHFGDAWWGYIGFDDCQMARTWSPQEIVMLRTASQMVASALQRWRAEAILQEAHDRLEERVRARTAELNEAVETLRREVAQRERAEAETHARLVVEHSLAAISSRLMQARDLDQALAGVLTEIGALYGAERVFFVRLQSDGQAIDRIDEWCRSGIAPIFDKVESWNLSGVSRWLDELHGRRSFYGGDMSQASHPFQAGIWHLGEDASGTRCAAPVYARDEMIGLLGLQGLASVDGNLGQDHQVLEVVLGMLGSAYSREQVLATLDQRIAVRTRELSTFLDLTTLAIGARDLRDMLDPIPGRILELGSCDAMCIHLLDEERTTLTLAAQGDLSPEMRRRLQAIALDGDLMRRLDHPGEPLVVTVQANMTPLPPPLRLEGFPSYLGVPLPGGWVSYYRSSPQGFSLDQSSLLLALAEQIGVIVENYRLRQRLETAITSEERKRLARDLHDSVTQSLYSLNLFARSGRDALQDGDTNRLTANLARLETTSLQALREMRLLLYELRPEMLEQEGLIRTLELRFDAVERRAGMNATVRYDRDGPELPQALERELYYLVFEALNNTLKHARAQKVTVRVSLSPSQLQLEIADDGCGFDPQQVSGGYGLCDMRERMERLGGELEISSTPGAGTRIVARVDLVQA